MVYVYVDMARSETYTWLALDEWAKILGYNRFLFNGITFDDCQTDNSCGYIWNQFPEQSDRASREEVADAIKEAEDMLSNYVKYNLLPDWEIDVLPTVRHYDPTFQTNIVPSRRSSWAGVATAGARVNAKSVRAEKGYVRLGGNEAKSVIAAGTTITRVDQDGDGFAETAQITVTTSVDNNEIRVYYPGESGDKAWEIRPIRITGTTVKTITFPIWLILRRDLIEELPCVEGHPATDNTIYLATVDVYRVYNDNTEQALLVYEPDLDCTGNCDQVFTSSCLYVRDERLGYVVYNPSLWTEPDKVELHLYSGWIGKTSRPLVEIDPYWAKAIAYLSVSILDKEPRNCCGGNESQLFSRWREDMSLNDGNKDRSYAVTQFILENPFGLTTKGAWFAYQRANAKGKKLP